MKKGSEQGFSIIELLLVCMIIGIIGALAVPWLQKSIRAAENGNMFATMRTIASTEVAYFQSNSRFGRITEINNLLSSSLGNPSGFHLTRGKFTLSTTPDNPPDAQLRDGYTINAIRNVTGEGVVYWYVIDQTGEIRQIMP